MAKPLSRLIEILGRPQHKEVALKSSGLTEIIRPFLGFFLFCIGKLLVTIFAMIFFDSVIPGFTAKPFTMYCAIGVLMLSPLGLHLFLAYQELVFYSFCSYYQTFAKLVMESSAVKPTLTRPKSTGTNNVVMNNASRETFTEYLEELIEIMKNMTKTFGPFLLQNFSLMLFYWLLHVYFICFVVIQWLRYPAALSDPWAATLTSVQFVGGILIVRWVMTYSMYPANITNI